MTDAAPPLAPPAVERPAPFAASYGIVSGTVAPGTRRVVVRVDGVRLGAVAVRARRFTLQVDLPPREVSVDVVALGDGGARSRTRVRNVQGMPVMASPADIVPTLDEELQGEIRGLVAAYRGHAGLYVLDLRSGRGAAANAQAQLPGASSLKLAVAVMALAAVDGVPASGSRLDVLLRRMLIRSDNLAANEVEAYAGGSTSGGSRRVDAMMAGLGLTRTQMYGGYLREPSGAGAAGRHGAAAVKPIPLRVDDQPAWGVGKRTTAYELGTLLRAVWLASGGLGPLIRTQPGFSAADGRYLLYLLARVDDHGKLDRFLPPGVAVLHKAGWIAAARHDNGLVVWPAGIALVSVMTYRSSGVGLREDELAGRIAQATLRHLRG